MVSSSSDHDEQEKHLRTVPRIWKVKGVGCSKSHLGYRILILVPEMGNWGQDDYLGEKLMLLTGCSAWGWAYFMSGFGETPNSHLELPDHRGERRVNPTPFPALEYFEAVRLTPA